MFSHARSLLLATLLGTTGLMLPGAQGTDAASDSTARPDTAADLRPVRRGPRGTRT